MKLHPSLSSDLAAWAMRQPVFFTGSAATHGAHINVSPKGLNAHFAVLGPNECAYIDRTGSGCETIAHSYENGRLCIMFMSFGDTPRIMRLFCRSTVVEWDQPTFPDLVRRVAGGQREAFDGARAVILCHIWEVQTSCGYGVPRIKKDIYAPDSEDPEKQQLSIEDVLRQGHTAAFSTEHDGKDRFSELAVFEQRPTLDKWAGIQVSDNKVENYQRKNNVFSMDGLPGLRAARRSDGQTLWLGDAKAHMARVAAEREALATGFVAAIVLYVVLAGFGLL